MDLGTSVTLIARASSRRNTFLSKQQICHHILYPVTQCVSAIGHKNHHDMPPKSKEAVTFSGAWISWAHTVVAYTAFLGALITGLYLHYHKIVENEYYVSPQNSRTLPPSSKLTHLKGYPDEWFPSVSATIGDRYPERSVFQLFIAMTSGTLPPLQLPENTGLILDA